ncbi:MAG: FAD-dependent oxidoreductase [Pseudomonadota bacterium]
MKILIVGAGQAGIQIAVSLRQGNFTGSITLIAKENYIPYQRPPLSKAFLRGDCGVEKLYLRTDKALENLDLDIRLGTQVAAIDRQGRRVEVDGQWLDYDKLAIATGTRPRPLPVAGAELDGVHMLRGIDDALSLKNAIEKAQNVVIVGGGFIGLEVAATASAASKNVTVIEAVERVMQRAVAPQISAWFEQMHRDYGVKILTGTGVEALQGENKVEAVRLADGTEVPADVVLVGVGAIPNSEIAADSGLSCPNGIEVDVFGATADPDVFAAGDCTWHPNQYAGGMFRLESVQNAVEQGKIVAKAMLGEREKYNAVPWFWSDQGSAKLQTTGLPVDVESTVIRGSMNMDKFTVFHLRGGRLLAADSVNSPADHMAARRLIGALVSAEDLADESTPLKSLLPDGKTPNV